MLNILKGLLSKIIVDIDAGNSNISEEEALKTVQYLNELTTKDKRLSKYAAYTYLNMSRATFDNLIKSGKLPKGKKEAGFKELSWNKKDLDKYINTYKKELKR